MPLYYIHYSPVPQGTLALLTSLQIQIGEHASTPRTSSLARATHRGTGEKASSPARTIPRRAHNLLAAGERASSTPHRPLHARPRVFGDARGWPVEEKRRAPDLDGEEDGAPVEEKKTDRQICLYLHAGRARASPASTPDLGQ